MGARGVAGSCHAGLLAGTRRASLRSGAAIPSRYAPPGGPHDTSPQRHPPSSAVVRARRHRHDRRREREERPGSGATAGSGATRAPGSEPGPRARGSELSARGSRLGVRTLPNEPAHVAALDSSPRQQRSDPRRTTSKAGTRCAKSSRTGRSGHGWPLPSAGTLFASPSGSFSHTGSPPPPPYRAEILPLPPHQPRRGSTGSRLRVAVDRPGRTAAPAAHWCRAARRPPSSPSRSTRADARASNPAAGSP